MFSKALFKQSCKANGAMWSIITFAVCFMLACVMLISGNGNIGEVKDSIQDTIITKEIDAQMQKRALSYGENAEDGLKKFDEFFVDAATDNLSILVWFSAMPNRDDFGDDATYFAAINAWKSAEPTMKTDGGKNYADTVNEWLSNKPSRENYDTDGEFYLDVEKWSSSTPASQEVAVAKAYAAACDELQSYIKSKAASLGYAETSDEANEMLGSVMYALNPNGTFNDFYIENGEDIPSDYDVLSLIAHISAGDVREYVLSEERGRYVGDRAADCASIFLAGNITKEESVNAMLDALSSYGVTKEKYQTFGYTYGQVKYMAQTAIVTYQGRLDYELKLLKEKYDVGDLSDSEYAVAVEDKKAELAKDISSSFLSTLPDTVSDALEEVGKADLYTLIVGSIFYKLAGLLLPIIYMIMASNNLIAGQVDSGSMAYVLSTSTKRKTVVFTQAVYLIGSLFAMFSLTTATGCVCLALISEEVGLTYGNLLLLNVGAFLVLFALSGLCFFTSCVFDRSKRSMAIGGGLSIFALVAAMLGLFGSPVIPSVVRLDALNNFNYVTVISLFDVISIIDGTGAFIWKFAILAVLGIIGYVAGSIRFAKKDLPL